MIWTAARLLDYTMAHTHGSRQQTLAADCLLPGAGMGGASNSGPSTQLPCASASWACSGSAQVGSGCTKPSHTIPSQPVHLETCTEAASWLENGFAPPIQVCLLSAPLALL